MPRATMAELIGRVRTLVSDPAGSGQTLSDDDIQAALDRTQVVVRYALLRPEPSPAVGGLIDVGAYRDYYSGVGDWESDEQLFDAAWSPLSPTASDRLTGHWTFASGVLPPVRIVGKTYDVYCAAADLLEIWAAKTKLDFDFQADTQQFARSQKTRALLDLAREYRRRQRAWSAEQMRSDLSPFGWNEQTVGGIGWGGWW